MRHGLTLMLAAASFAATIGIASTSAEPRCRMEQQCHWVNFKKVCTWVKVCR